MTIKVDHYRPNVQGLRRIALAPLGEWDWSDGETVNFTSDRLGFIWYPIPPGFGRGPLSLLYPEGFDYAVGVFDGGETAWRFLSSDGRIQAVGSLAGRDEVEDGFQFFKGFANKEGMAIVYETGLLFLDRAGGLRWRQTGLKLDWTFRELLDTGVLYEDGRGRQWVYSIDNGSREEAKTGKTEEQIGASHVPLKSIPGTSAYLLGSGQNYVYFADDEVRSFRAQFRSLTNGADASRIKRGGMTSQACRLWLPDGSLFYPVGYHGDFEGMRALIEEGARLNGVLLGQIEGDSIVVRDGRSFRLDDCKAEFGDDRWPARKRKRRAPGLPH
jgi:hypothetical protein